MLRCSFFLCNIHEADAREPKVCGPARKVEVKSSTTIVDSRHGTTAWLPFTGKAHVKHSNGTGTDFCFCRSTRTVANNSDGPGEMSSRILYERMMEILRAIWRTTYVRQTTVLRLGDSKST